jgi:hypothetical protein
MRPACMPQPAPVNTLEGLHYVDAGHTDIDGMDGVELEARRRVEDDGRDIACRSRVCIVTMYEPPPNLLSWTRTILMGERAGLGLGGQLQQRQRQQQQDDFNTYLLQIDGLVDGKTEFNV